MEVTTIGTWSNEFVIVFIRVGRSWISLVAVHVASTVAVITVGIGNGLLEQKRCSPVVID